MAISDEEFRAGNLRKEQFKQLAKNPTEGTTVYRMQSGDPEGSLGIHWTTDPNVAHHTGLGGSGDDRTVHRGTIDPEQVISQGEWMGNNIRSYHREDGKVKAHPTQWGLDMEAELRLRPGTTVRDHAVSAAGAHEYTPTGREPTIEARGNYDYLDLSHHAVQGTPEAARLHDLQYTLPHVQQTMFDNVVNMKTDEHIGYTPKWGMLRSSMSMSDAIDFSMNDVDRIGKGAGLGEYEAGTETAKEPLLSDLRNRTEEFHDAHQTASHDPRQGTLF